MKCSIEHNGQSYDQLRKRLVDAIGSRLEKAKKSIYGLQEGFIDHMRSEITKNVWNQIDFYKHANIISFNDRSERNGTIVNIIHVNEKSNDKNISSLIQELNDSYDRICMIKDSWDTLTDIYLNELNHYRLKPVGSVCC